MVGAYVIAFLYNMIHLYYRVYTDMARRGTA